VVEQSFVRPLIPKLRTVGVAQTTGASVAGPQQGRCAHPTPFALKNFHSSPSPPTTFFALIFSHH
jgi:hypothetical protein